jgi:hypothetical protein
MNRIASPQSLAHALRQVHLAANSAGAISDRRWFMANENELFYLVLVIVLTLIMHFILVAKGPRRGDKSR